MNKTQARQRTKALREEIAHHRYQYHVLDKQEISDAVLDSLKRELAELERQFPELITPDSPTQRVGGVPLPEFRHVRHSKPMLSLHDAFTAEDLIAWEERNRKIVPLSYEYFIEEKVDGVAVALLYTDGLLMQAATRGDGVRGEDVTHNIRTIDAVPLRLRKKIKGELEVRGEVYMLKKDFERMNALRASQGKQLFANPRNIAAGSIRQLDPGMARERPLRFFAWEITRGIELTTREEEYNKLQELGFAVPPGGTVYQSIPTLLRDLPREEKRRDAMPFQVDGLVIKINGLSVSRRLGIVGKAPRHSIAYKFAAEEATTVVEDILVQVGRTGALTPVAHLTPVRVAGTAVSRATLHNAAEVRRKDIRVGDTVIIRKAGDIIPEVVQAVPRLRPKKSKPFQMPDACPICGSKVMHEEGGIVLRCANPDCFPQQRERILHAVGDSGFDIDGLGEKIIEQLLQEGLIEQPPDLWELTAGDLQPLERFAEKSAQNLVDEIALHTQISLPRFLVALSIPNVGVVTAQDLAGYFGTLEAVVAAHQDELQKVNGVGPKVAEGIAGFFRQSEQQTLIKRYRKVGVIVEPYEADGDLAGKTFVFTGSLGEMTRDEAKQRVQERGGRIASTVSHDVDYVVIGEDPGSKAKKAQELGVTVLTPAEFKKMMRP